MLESLFVNSQNESLSEPDRYKDVAGWQPKDPYEKQRKEAKKNPAKPFPTETMIATRSANLWRPRHVDRKAVSTELFSTLWREGEVAVLLGQKGVGKSLLAVQIAESIARGISSPPYEGGVAAAAADGVVLSSRSQSLPTVPRKVLYLDFQRTARQWAERYSVPSPIPGKLPVKYRFSPNLIRSAIEWDGYLPPEYKGSIARFLERSIENAIFDSEAKVVIIDDLSYISRLTAVASGAIKIMQSIKLWAATYGLSIMVVVPARQKRRATPATLNDVLGNPQICQQADTVFTLAPSTFGPAFRYLKHLASPHQITHHAENLLTFELERSTGFQKTEPQKLTGSQASRLPSSADPNERGVAAAAADEVAGAANAAVLPKMVTQGLTLNPSLITPHSPLPPTPFLGLKPLGPSTEQDHLRNYAAESQAAQLAQERQIKRLAHRSSKAALVDGFLDGSFARYLKGE